MVRTTQNLAWPVTTCSAAASSETEALIRTTT